MSFSQALAIPLRARLRSAVGDADVAAVSAIAEPCENRAGRKPLGNASVNHKAPKLLFIAHVHSDAVNPSPSPQPEFLFHALQHTANRDRVSPTAKKDAHA